MVTVTLTANRGYSFSAWSGVTVIENKVTITGNTSITATFTPVEYSLSVTVDPTGSGSLLAEPLTDSYQYGDLVTLTPTADPGYTFSSWSGATVTDNKVTITGNTSITATFTQNEYSLSVTVDPTGSGSVLVEPVKDSYHSGAFIPLTLTTNPC